MPQGRPAVPAQLRRDLLVEAGHRCAIPTCRAAAPLECEHIDDWEKVKKHEFANMIVLCANCHGRKGGRPGQIDRLALRQYKANLAVLNGRYGDLELRILDAVAKKPLQTEFVLPAYMGLLVSYLIKDGLLRRDDSKPDYRVRTQGVFGLDLPVAVWYAITEEGLDFIERWKSARPLD